MGDAAAASSGPLLPQLQSEGRGGNREGERKREMSMTRSTNFNSFPFTGETMSAQIFETPNLGIINLG